MIALVCAGCAQSRTDRGSGSPAGGGAPHISPEVAAAAKICRWSIANSLYRTHTTPGSYVTRPPGSCPHAELAAALALADGLKAGGSRGAGICQLLAPDALSNARRVAMNTMSLAARRPSSPPRQARSRSADESLTSLGCC
jgi:hypothetical protein